MASLLEELTGLPLYFRRKMPGRRVSFALPGELAAERVAVEDDARAKAAAVAEKGDRVQARHLILSALRDGRARYESDIVAVTTLRPYTVEDHLRRLRAVGEVESIQVGRHRMWARTMPERN